jgi:hypothetical protein
MVMRLKRMGICGAMRSTSIPVLSLFASVLVVLWGCGDSRKAVAPDGATPAADAPLGSGEVTGAGGTIAIATGGASGGTGSGGVSSGDARGANGGSTGTTDASNGSGGSTTILDGAPAERAGTGGSVGSPDAGAGDVAIGGDGAARRDGANAPPCPSAPPHDGASCVGEQRCFYEDCAGAGRTSATCANDVWTVASATCQRTSCQSGMANSQCDPGTLCLAIASGVPVALCTPNGCGGGPISCDCLASCSGTCRVSGTAESGFTIECNPNCPVGGCV